MTSHSEYEPRGDGPLSGGHPVDWHLFNHVMIDIETMSLHRHKALILSVGMIEFDPAKRDRVIFGNRSRLILNIPEQILLGRHVDPKTQKWWAAQPAEASDHWRNAVPNDITGCKLVMTLVRDFCAGKENVWANGTQFDLSNLDGLAEDVGDTKELWHYRAPCDMRTFVRHVKPTRLMNIETLDEHLVSHEPISDCISQAHGVWERWSDE